MPAPDMEREAGITFASQPISKISGQCLLDVLDHLGADLIGQRSTRGAARSAVATGDVLGQLDGLDELVGGVPEERGLQVLIEGAALLDLTAR